MIHAITRLQSIEKPAIHTTLMIGAIACLFLTLFWDRTTEINGSPHSVAFLLLAALLAIVDCTTSVLYMPFMAHYKSKYLMSYLIGQGLSGLIPSIVAIIQGLYLSFHSYLFQLVLFYLSIGVGGNPKCVNSTTEANKTVPEYPEANFSVEVFFVFLMIMVLISWLAFILLVHLDVCRAERVTYKEDDDKVLPRVSSGVETDSSQSSDDRNYSTESRLNNESYLTRNNEQNLSTKSFMVLLVTQAYICALTNGVLPSNDNQSWYSIDN